MLVVWIDIPPSFSSSSSSVYLIVLTLYENHLLCQVLSNSYLDTPPSVSSCSQKYVDAETQTSIYKILFYLFVYKSI